jgi:hypothetical protein
MQTGDPKSKYEQYLSRIDGLQGGSSPDPYQSYLQRIEALGSPTLATVEGFQSRRPAPGSKAAPRDATALAAAPRVTPFEDKAAQHGMLPTAVPAPRLRGPRTPVTTPAPADATRVSTPGVRLQEAIDGVQNRPQSTIKDEAMPELGDLGRGVQREIAGAWQQTPAPVRYAVAGSEGLLRGVTVGRPDLLASDDKLDRFASLPLSTGEQVARGAGMVLGAGGAIAAQNAALSAAAPLAPTGKLRGALESFSSPRRLGAGALARDVAEGVPYDLLYPAEDMGERVQNVALGTGGAFVANRALSLIPERAPAPNPADVGDAVDVNASVPSVVDAVQTPTARVAPATKRVVFAGPEEQSGGVLATVRDSERANALLDALESEGFAGRLAPTEDRRWRIVVDPTEARGAAIALSNAENRARRTEQRAAVADDPPPPATAAPAPTDLFGVAREEAVEQTGMFTARDLAPSEKAAAERISSRPMNAEDVAAQTRQMRSEGLDLLEPDTETRDFLADLDMGEPLARERIRTPESEGFQYRPPANRTNVFTPALRKAREMDDASLVDAFQERLRVATRTGGDRMSRGDGYARANAQSADARMDAYGQVLDARGISRPSNTDAYRQVPEREVTERFDLGQDVERAAMLEDDALLSELRAAEGVLQAGQPDRTALERLYVLAGQAKERGLVGDEYGAMQREIARTLAGMGAGGAVGGATDSENPARGAATGALLGAGAMNAPALLRGARAMGETGAVGDLRLRFYSRLQRAIENAPQEKGTAAQWRGWLSKDVAKGEREWTGIDRMLDAAETEGRNLTRDDVLGAFQQGEIRLGETVLRDGPDTRNIRPLRATDQGGYWEVTTEDGEFVSNVMRHEGFDTVDSAIAEARRRLGEEPARAGQPAGRPKFASYTEPGGENYREILLTLKPKSDSQFDPAKLQLERRRSSSTQGAIRFVYDGKPLGGGDGWFGEKGGASAPFYTDEEAAEIARKLYEQGHPIQGGGTQFKSSHFDQPNVLAHARVKDRTLPNGERVLFVEEIQSDWHQAGRSRGYKSAEAEAARKQESEQVERQLQETPRGTPEWGQLLGRRTALHMEGQGVPDAPFKKTDEWMGLAWRRLIDEAVEGGYDRVAWTTGDQQVTRYKDALTKAADEIAYNPADGHFTAKKGGEVVHTGNYDSRALDAVVGKEGARQLLETAPDGAGVHVLNTSEMSVGGEGMRYAYDRMLPKTVRDYAKKMGVKLDVEPTDVFGPARIDVDSDLYPEQIERALRRVRVPESRTALEEIERYAEDTGVSLSESADVVLAEVEPATRREVLDALGAADMEVGGITNPSVRIPEELKQKVRTEGQYLYTGGDISRALRTASGRTVAGAAAGGAAGGAVDLSQGDDSNPIEGMLLGAGLANAPAMVRRLRGPQGARPAYLQDPAVQTVLGTVSEGEQAPSILSRLTGARGKLKQAGRDLYTTFIDEAAPLKRFGREVEGSERLADEAARAKGWSGAANITLQREFRPVVQMAKGHEDGVVALTKAQRALELLDAGLEKTDIPRETLEQTVAALEQVPEVKRAADALRAYYRSLLDRKLANGVLSQEQYDEITQSGNYYIPFVRDFFSDINTKPAGGLGGKLLAKGTGVRRMDEGKARAKTVDPFKQAILDTMEAERRIAKQRVTNLVAEIVESEGGEVPGIIRKVPPKFIGETTDGRVLTEAPYSQDGKVVEANVGGKRTFYEVLDEDLYDAWAAFDPYTGNWATKLLRPFKELLRFGVTANPLFALANGIRDFSMSVVQYPSVVSMRPSVASAAGGAAVGAAADDENRLRGALGGAAAVSAGLGALNAGAHIGRTLSAMQDILGPEVMGSVIGGTAGAFAGNEQDHPFLGFLAGAAVGAGVGKAAGMVGLKGNRATYEAWQAGGGSGFGFYARNEADAARALRMLQSDGVSMEDVLNIKRWGDAISFISRAVEEAPRLARYKNILANGGDEAAAIAASRDLSLDFARQGRGMKGLNATNAFLNAQVQGWDKLARLLNPTTEQGKRAYGIAATTILAPSVALWSLNMSNDARRDAYLSRPQWERNLYWLVPKDVLGGEVGSFYRVPKPFEVGFIFASIPERVLDYAYSKDPEALKFALSDMATQYGPGAMLPLTTLGEPLIENIANHDFFRGRPVVTPGLDELPGELQYDDKTSSVAVGIGKLTGYSPQKIDNFVRDITGSLGGEALRQSSKLARNVGLDTRPEPPEKGGPFLARFETQPDQISDMEMAVYRRWREAEAAYQGAQHLYKQGQTDRLAEFVRENRDQLLAYEQLKQVRADLDEVWDARRQVEASDLPAERKREILTRINQAVAGALQTWQQSPAYAEMPR